MSYFNTFSREVFCKIVYCGPGLSGKTTNVEILHQRAPPAARGKLVSLKTESDRTLFFDFLPIDLGEIRGYRVRLQLYTVPGQVFYRASRRLILRGADAIVFVADSQSARIDANVEAMSDLRENLGELCTPLESLPCVVQYNKRDLDGIEPLEVLRAQLNPMGAPEVESVASSGLGVLETLKVVARLALRRLAA